MTTSRLTTLMGAAALVAATTLGGRAAMAAPIGLVDDFSGNLSAWTATRIHYANGGGCKTMRLNFSHSSPERIAQGVERLARSMAQL